MGVTRVRTFLPGKPAMKLTTPLCSSRDVCIMDDKECRWAHNTALKKMHDKSLETTYIVTFHAKPGGVGARTEK